MGPTSSYESFESREICLEEEVRDLKHWKEFSKQEVLHDWLKIEGTCDCQEENGDRRLTTTRRCIHPTVCELGRPQLQMRASPGQHLDFSPMGPYLGRESSRPVPGLLTYRN